MRNRHGVIRDLSFTICTFTCHFIQISSFKCFGTQRVPGGADGGPNTESGDWPHGLGLQILPNANGRLGFRMFWKSTANIHKPQRKPHATPEHCMACIAIDDSLAKHWPYTAIAPKVIVTLCLLHGLMSIYIYVSFCALSSNKTTRP